MFLGAVVVAEEGRLVEQRLGAEGGAAVRSQGGLEVLRGDVPAGDDAVLQARYVLGVEEVEDRPAK